MPPKSDPPLTSRELTILKSWIDQGALPGTDLTPAKSALQETELGPLPKGYQPIYALDISPDSKTLAAGLGYAVVLFDLASKNEVARLSGHKDIVQSLAFSPDGNTLAAGGSGTIIVWKKFEEPAPKPLPTSVKSEPKAVPPANSKAAPLANAKGTTPANVKAAPANPKGADPTKLNAEPKKVDPKNIAKTVGPSAPPKQAPMIQSTWKLWKEFAPVKGRVAALAYRPDGLALAAGAGLPTASAGLTIWDLQSGKLLSRLNDLHSDVIFATAWKKDGKEIATASADKFVKVHDVATGKLIRSFEGHTEHALGVAWHADQKTVVSCAADGTIRFWNHETGDPIRTSQGHGKHISSLRVIAGTNLLVTSCGDRVVRLVDANNGNVIRGFNGAGDFLDCAVASPDQKVVAGAGQDGKIYLWELGTAKSLGVIGK